jgi:ABC-2 type transport system permease protein
MNLGFYVLIYRYTDAIGPEHDWGKHQFFVFLATSLFANSVVQAFFMPNVEEFSELIRTGGLDFALVKPIDTQFLVSLRRMEWSALGNFLFAAGLLAYALAELYRRYGYVPSPWAVLLYPLYVGCGVAILYSVMIGLAATSIWLGRNQTLYDFWFYITNFARYPLEIYQGPFGTPLQWLFTFIVPVLVVANVPARLLARPLAGDQLPLAAFALVATWASLWASRWFFRLALESYRSASS